MMLAEVVSASQAVAATRSRAAKVATLAQALTAAAQHPGGDIATVTAYLSGAPPQRRLGVSWRGLSVLPPPAEAAELTVSECDARLQAIADLRGPGSGSRRAELVRQLFARATMGEQRFLRAVMTGQMRQGALDAVVLQAVARAADVPEAYVRRAVMLAGQAAAVAEAALRGGEEALAAIGLEVGRPVRPMLASAAPGVEAAVEALGGGAPALAVECKLDGIRIQAHKRGDAVRVFTRTLDDATERLPEVVELVRGLPAATAVLDGEVIALRQDGRPHPFQVTGSRAASTVSPESLRLSTPLTAYFFDLLHRDGRDLLDLPAAERFAQLAQLVPPASLVPRAVVSDPAAARAFFDAMVAAGHEGVVLKDLTVAYAAGSRGAGWVKVKPRHTLDLVVLAVEWGSGRRAGLLSNIHLGARDPDTGGFVMLGKTFKGMTDQMLAWQTERFLQLETARSGQLVWLRPEQVVEVAFDGIQASTRYPGGMALRFARVLRYRQDKTADQADTVEAVRALRER